jgi:hypothetical protein
MRELASSFAQLIAIIMVTLVLAVSTAAVSLWATADASGETGDAGTQTQSILAADARP